MLRPIAKFLGITSLSVVLFSCNSSQSQSNDKAAESASVLARDISTFSADSAYNNVAAQVAFGPRVPGSSSHDACRDWIASKLSDYEADTVIVQNGTMKAFNGDILPVSNVIASYNKEAADRVLLVAHYDTRPWADQESDMVRRKQPIPGANDGGSGVGVLLEVARNLNMRKAPVGVDLLFVDAEDYGTNSGFGNNPETWCLGTQMWLKNPLPYGVGGKMPRYGILLDMVGGRDARFHIEVFAHHNAPEPTSKVWNEARALGYEDIFINQLGGPVTDDHVFLTEAGIPTTDIIECNNAQTSGFPPTWHTHADDMDNISRSSLDAVGRTVLNVIYREKASTH